jgi:FlaA1/EpsC-like NDP-sugar epimerase
VTRAVASQHATRYAAIDWSEVATGRPSDLFEQDWRTRRSEIEAAISGRRLLVIGGAGSIGSATVKLIADFRPQALHVVDQNENNLAELVRDLRSREEGLDVRDFRTIPIDFGSPVMRRFVASESSYDLILNFAAIKHVRSEKDTCSVLQMLDTNVVKPARFLQWMRDRGADSAYFSISTDKAANPVNLMGASKRLMEHVLFADGHGSRRMSSRFANVAFSDGSLLASFIKRLEKRQPIACPEETRRFFISMREAGEICVLAAACAPNRSIAIPRMDSEKDLRTLDQIAAMFLSLQGFEPRIYRDEQQARMKMGDDLRSGYYPLLLTALDTAGEKPYEEFVGDGEEGDEFGMSNLLAVRYAPVPADSVAKFVDEMEKLVADPNCNIEKRDLVRMMGVVVPELRHNEQRTHLDQRM